MKLFAACCRGYINPKATGKQIIRFSRFVIVGFGLFMGVLAIILLEIGLSLGWGEWRVSCIALHAAHAGSPLNKDSPL